MPAIQPRVSIIVIAYRQPGFLNQALASVEVQDFEDYELIVVDDGSGDEVVGQYRLPAGARLIRHGTCGGAAAASRNSGIREARGELIAFLDQDDSWKPQHLSAAVAAFDSRPELGLVQSGFLATDEHLQPLAAQPKVRSLPSERQALIRGFLKRNLITTPSSVVVSRAALEACSDMEHVFDVAVTGASDRDLWLRLPSVSELASLPEVTTLYRTHPAQLHRNERATRPGRLGFHEKTLRWAQREQPQMVRPIRRSFAKLLRKCASRDLAAGPHRDRSAARASLRRARRLDPWNLAGWTAGLPTKRWR